MPQKRQCRLRELVKNMSHKELSSFKQVKARDAMLQDSLDKKNAYVITQADIDEALAESVE